MKREKKNYNSPSTEETIFRSNNNADSIYFSHPNKDINNRNIFIFKVILVGDGGAGKTSIFDRFTTNSFSDNFSCTMKVDYKVKSIVIDKDNTVDLQVWDTCGQEKYKTVTRSYYRNNHGCIIVFDITKKESYNNVLNWYNDLKEFGQKGQTIVLVGNKKDLSEKREVYFKEIDELASRLNLTYIEISAKTGENVMHLFEYIALKFLKKEEYLRQIPENSNFSTSNVMRNSITINKTLHSEKFHKNEKSKIKNCC